MIDQSFWKGKRVFVTGHTGFKGSWLIQWLLMLGATVKGYSLEPDTTPSLFTVLSLSYQISHEIGDIRNADQLKQSVESFKPDVVFHLAAQPLVRRSYWEPRLTYETNVMGTLNLYEAVRGCDSVRSLVSITTDKCYENKEWVWGYRENDPMGGHDPYSSSKGCMELLTSAYRHSYFHPDEYGKSHQLGLATARAGNVIGGGDWAEDRLIPDCIRSLSRNEEIVIRNPKSTRPWQHVLEPLSGYLLLAQRLYEMPKAYSEGWNFGPGDSGVVPVSEVVSIMVEVWGNGSVKINDEGGPHEANLLKLDISKAEALLNWRPRLSIKSAIENTMEWYRSFYSGDTDLSLLTKDQIKQFQNLMVEQ